MYEGFVESAVLIGLMVLSIEYNSHRHPNCQSLHTLQFSRKHLWTTGAGQNSFLYVLALRRKCLTDRSNGAFNQVKFASLCTVPIRFLSLRTPSFSRMHRRTTGAGQNSSLYV
jgi:hypothetical protein